MCALVLLLLLFYYRHNVSVVILCVERNKNYPKLKRREKCNVLRLDLLLVSLLACYVRG